jgi:hypothetical protein
MSAAAATVTESAQQTLLRTWSDPLAHAHRDWCAAWPAALLARASQTPAARRGIVLALRAAVPLRPLSSLDGEHTVPWALGTARQIYRTVDEAGLVLMRRWIVRAVSRADVRGVIAFLGREHYDAALQPAPELWFDAQAAPQPDYSLPADRLQQVFRRLGFHALNGALAGELEAFRGRMRLLTGPLSAAGDGQPPLAIDNDALLRYLRGDNAADAAA